jgi:hypothetical protein
MKMQCHAGFTPRIALVILSLLSSLGVSLPQASFLLDNLVRPGVVDAPVFTADGIPLAGKTYMAELWGGANPNSLAPLTLFPSDARIATPFLQGGYFDATAAGGLSVLTAPPGGWAWLQVRAWDTRLAGTYEQVAALGLGGYGESPLLYARGGNPYDQFPEPGRLIGLQSFSLLPVVPEPAMGWLLLAGIPALCWRWRRRGPPR